MIRHAHRNLDAATVSRLANSELVTVLKEGFDQLSQRQREVLYEFLVDGSSIERIAHRNGCRDSTVRQRLREVRLKCGVVTNAELALAVAIAEFTLPDPIWKNLAIGTKHAATDALAARLLNKARRT